MPRRVGWMVPAGSREVGSVDSPERMRAGLGAAVAGGGLSAADRLCLACVELLQVDGAAISVVHDGASRGTFGSSGWLSRRLDEYQFTFGEGPCLDAVASGRPVLVANLGLRDESRWPAFTEAVLAAGVRAVFALPVLVTTAAVGALDLFRNSPGSLAGEGMAGGLLAAELAALPLLDLLATDVDWVAEAEGTAGGRGAASELASLERVEVYQATGMIMADLDVDAAEALLRLRAYAFTQSLTASEVAWQIVERRLVLRRDGSWPGPAGPGASS